MVRRLVVALALSSLVVPPLLLACVTDDPGPSQITCEDYCAVVQSRCVGNDAQYRSMDECRKVCPLLDLGKISDVDVPTVGCRYNKALESAVAGNCLAAGPFGGGKCGDRCTTFCSIASKTCTGDANPFPDGCTELCGQPGGPLTFDPASGPEAPPSGATPGDDDLNCRERHLIVAVAEGQPHCSHVAPVSELCRDADTDAGDAGADADTDVPEASPPTDSGN